MAKNMAALEAARDLDGRLKKLVGDARAAEAKVAAALLEMNLRGGALNAPGSAARPIDFGRRKL